jgi:hypothetical protein
MNNQSSKLKKNIGSHPQIRKISINKKERISANFMLFHFPFYHLVSNFTELNRTRKCTN